MRLSVLALVVAAAPAAAQEFTPPPVLPGVLPAAACDIEPAFPPPIITDDPAPGLFPGVAPVAALPPDARAIPHDVAGGWFGAADVLIFRPRVGGSDFALTDPVNDGTPQGTVRSMNYGSNAGLRVTAGYRLPASGWELALTYTGYHGSGSATAGVPPGGVLVPLRTRPGVVDRAALAAASGSLDYSVFDLDAARTWQVDPYLTLKAFGGVRIASLDSAQTYRYDGLQARMATVAQSSGFDGAGPTGGLETTWRLGERFSMFGTARGGLLYGDFRGNVRETNGSGAVVVADVGDRYSGVAPFMAVGLGVGWRWRTVTFAAGYEVTHWFNVFTRTAVGADGRPHRQRDDLNLEGVFLRVGVGF